MQCIERKKNCDGEVDCVNGADEENCSKWECAILCWFSFH